MNWRPPIAILSLTILGVLASLMFLSSSDSQLNYLKDIAILKKEKFRQDLFEGWMQKHRKTYSGFEKNVRFAIWNQNYDIVQEHNAKNLSWTLGMNKFADLSSEEFASLYLGFRPDLGVINPDNVEILEETDLGETVDWRTKGAITSIDDQKECGGCWSFSAAGALEAIYKIRKNILYKLSKQQQIDCSSSYGNQGCNGGFMDYAFAYTKDKGIEKESDYPYEARDASCRYNSSKVVFKNTGFRDVTQNNYTQLQAAVKLQPVSIGVQAEGTLQMYQSGIITSNCGTELDHGILIVGYETSGTAHWIIRNSWSTQWGEQGYFRLAMGQQNNGAGLCGVNMAPSYPLYNVM